MASDNEDVKRLAEGAFNVAAGHAIKKGVDTVMPGAGTVGGTLFSAAPAPIKVGAGVGMFVGVNTVTHAIVATGSTAVVAVTAPMIVPLVCVGAAIGGVVWLVGKLK